jgi:adenosylhomocysteinase
VFPVFAVKGQSLEEHWDYLDKSSSFPTAPNLILDDGGDATLYVLLGARAEAGETDIIPVPASEEEESSRSRSRSACRKAPGWFTKVRDQIKSASPKRPPPAFTGSTNCMEEGPAAFPGLQRQ